MNTQNAGAGEGGRRSGALCQREGKKKQGNPRVGDPTQTWL